jgi:hypothetical protein
MLRPCLKPAVRANWCPTFALAWRLPELRRVLRRCLNRGRQCISSRSLARRLCGSRGRGRGRSKSRSGRAPHLSSSGCTTKWLSRCCPGGMPPGGPHTGHPFRQPSSRGGCLRAGAQSARDFPVASHYRWIRPGKRGNPTRASRGRMNSRINSILSFYKPLPARHSISAKIRNERGRPTGAASKKKLRDAGTKVARRSDHVCAGGGGPKQ